MKKYIFITSVIFVLILLVCFFQVRSMVKFNDESIGFAKFIYGDTQVETKISDQNLKQIVEILKGKILKSDLPSCGFTENVSVKIDDKTFCIACDECGVIYLLEEDKYLYLSDEENKIIRKILESYEFKFPCV